MRLKKQRVLAISISVFCSVFFMVNHSFGHVRSSSITKITKVLLNKQGVTLYSTGQPVIEKNTLKTHHGTFFILSIRDSVLIGKGHTISRPFPFVSKLSVTQFKTNPDIVHLVMKEASVSPFSVNVSHTADDRYVTTIDPVYQLNAFEHSRSSRITKITKVVSTQRGVRLYSTGRPAIEKYKFKKHRDTFLIVSFRNSILIGKGQSISSPFPAVSKLTVTQFKTNPDIVHLVMKEASFSPFSGKVSPIANGRYVTTLYPVYHFTVFIDAGHGGKDPGGVGPYGLPESFVNLNVALTLKHLLEKRGIHAELDRNSDRFVSLSQRVRKANESRADLFIGLYCNASKDDHLCGTTTYYDHAKSFKFSKFLGNFVSKRLGTKYDGTLKDNLYVIKGVRQMPAVLIEYAYISNKHEERLLASPWFRHRLARSLANAICTYYILPKTGARSLG